MNTQYFTKLNKNLERVLSNLLPDYKNLLDAMNMQAMTMIILEIKSCVAAAPQSYKNDYSHKLISH